MLWRAASIRRYLACGWAEMASGGRDVDGKSDKDAVGTYNDRGNEPEAPCGREVVGIDIGTRDEERFEDRL